MEKDILKIMLFVIVCLLLYPQAVNAQNYDCEMYNKALINLDERWDSIPATKKKLKLYYYIRKSKITFRKEFLGRCNFESIKDEPLKWEELSFSSLETDSINCNFCENLNYEYHYEEDAPFLFKDEDTINLNTTEYLPVEIRFSKILYKNNQFALFLMLHKFKHITAAFRFLFEKKEANWELKEILVDTD